MEKENKKQKVKIKQNKNKPKINENSIWSLPVTLKDMNKIKDSKFEYENSHDYVKEYDLSKITQKLLNSQSPRALSLIQPNSIAEQSQLPQAKLLLDHEQQTQSKRSPPVESLPRLPELLPQPDVKQLALSKQAPLQPSQHSSKLICQVDPEPPAPTKPAPHLLPQLDPEESSIIKPASSASDVLDPTPDLPHLPESLTQPQLELISKSPLLFPHSSGALSQRDSEQIVLPSAPATSAALILNSPPRSPNFLNSEQPLVSKVTLSSSFAQNSSILEPPLPKIFPQLDPEASSLIKPTSSASLVPNLSPLSQQSPERIPQPNLEKQDLSQPSTSTAPMLLNSPSLLPQPAEILESPPHADEVLFAEDSDDSVNDKDFDPGLNCASSSTECMTSEDNDDVEPAKKRKKVKRSIPQMRAQKLKQNLEKYSMKPPCSNLCKKLCTLNFTEEKRLSIHADYWAMDWETRGIFLKSVVDANECTRSTSKNPKRRRDVTYKYYFLNEGRKIEVCKIFFLCTLGYNKKNDRHVLTALKKAISDQKDKRDGRNLKKTAVDKDLLTNHVNSYNPCVHHYRREHAPNKKYLPSDITISTMHEDFVKKYPELKCCYETYRHHVTNVMNISFAKLGNEECELCETFDLHNGDHVKAGFEPSCNICNTYVQHKEKYRKARKAYDSDAKKTASDENIYVSADLQKVIMLPRLDSFKTAIFCTRIVAYNETFVLLGKYTTTNPVFAVVWHEAISGRKQEDLVSSFRAFLLSKRDANEITIWLDNCSAQNKNWCLLTFLISVINGDEIAASKIVLKYFEPGHTFMSADSFHHSVEQSLQKTKKVYDFSDFTQAVENASVGKVVVKKMETSDFFIFKSHVSQQKLKDPEGNRVYLKDVVEVMVQRGKFCLFLKTDFDSEEYSLLSCLKSRKIPKAQAKPTPKGITLARKQEILKKLGPLMPENRQAFWKDLPTANAEDDSQLEFDIDQ